VMNLKASYQATLTSVIAAFQIPVQLYGTRTFGMVIGLL
jgi:hypothetical protein